MPKIEKFIAMPANMVDASIKEKIELLKFKLEYANKLELRVAFNDAMFDSAALACITVANELGFTELAKEFIEVMEEMEATND
jgi:hypothetical protein